MPRCVRFFLELNKTGFEMSESEKKRHGKAAAIALALMIASSPAATSEEISASFARNDAAFAPHPQLMEFGKYPIRHGFQGIQIETGVVSKTSDTCTDPGEADGSFRCLKTFSNGNKVQMTADQEHHGEDFKRQVVIAEFNASGQILGRQTVRQKTAYKDLDGKKKVRAEFFDIVNRPKDGKITREVIIYEYNLTTGMAQTISWTSYEQIGDSGFAMITRHVALTYDRDGRPLMGRAEKWKNEVPVEKLFSWNRMLDGTNRLDINSWETWKTQILNASPRQIF
jgi:hypothetical protein